VIDYDSIEPESSENIAVVALVVKKRAAPLGRGDRKYIGEVWDQLSEVLGKVPGGREDFETLLKESAIVKHSPLNGATFNLRETPDGQYRFFFQGSTGKVIGVSPSFATKQEALQAFGPPKKKQADAEDPWATHTNSNSGFSDDPPF
jgi:uncharacterized protein YegP (UPF0339 family)